MLSPTLYLFPAFLTQVSGSEPLALAYEKQVQELMTSSPQTLVIVQSDMGVFPDAMNFVSPKEGFYKAGEQTVAADLELGRQMQVSLEEHQRSSHLIEETELLTNLEYFLTRVSKYREQMPRILVLGPSLQSAEEHYKVGSLLRRAIDADTDKVAVVCLGHLSSQMDKDSDFGYSRFGKEYQEDFLRYFQPEKMENFLCIDPFLLDDVAESLYKPAAMLLGIASAIEQKVSIDLADFVVGGVGYAVGKIVKD